MDALRRDAAILRALLLAGPGITAMLIGFVAFMIAILPDETRLNGFQICTAFALICLVARASWRVRQVCDSAGRLGIAHHAKAIQRAQCIIIAASTVLPISIALGLGGGLQAFVIFIGATAFAIYIFETVFFAFFAGLVAKGLAASGVDVWALVFGIPGSMLILSASIWGIARWVMMPPRLEKQAGEAAATLADSMHEAVEREELEIPNSILDRDLEDALQPTSHDVLSPRRLWIGMGYDPRSDWRINAVALAIAIIALVVLHFWKRAHWDLGAYWGVSALIGVYAFGRFQQMNAAWLRSSGEQGLLVLSARWPSRSALKVVLLRSVWSGIPALFVQWMLFSAAAILVGWVTLANVLLALLALAASLVSMLGIFISYFSHSRLKATNLLPLLYLLIALVGTTTLVVAVGVGSPFGTWVGVALVLIPFALSLIAFACRPALFPVHIATRKIR